MPSELPSKKTDRRPAAPILAFIAFAALSVGSPLLRAADDGAALRASFAEPPADARPLVRWWWYGPAVTKPELEKEMKRMKQGGFGGFEVQPTYPLARDGEYPGLKNLKFLSPEFLNLLGYSAEQAKALGLRMDLTLGSGWPYGGPMFSREEAAQSIADAGQARIAPDQTTVKPPNGTDGGPLIAALLGPVPRASSDRERYIPLKIEGGSAVLPPDRRGATAVRFFTRAPAGLMKVKRPAFGAEGLIVDHYSPAAVQKFIADVALPEVEACGANAPYSLFCDSLETGGEGWTPTLPEEFRRRRGYDLVPLLPALFEPDFPHAAEIRADYGRTLMEMFDEHFVDAFTRLAHDHQSRFRIQAYGTPPTSLGTYGHADMDEGENWDWKGFSASRWASSASHVLGRAVASAEAFTWLHSPVFMMAPIDIKAEADLQFLSGINQFTCHGWPYTPPGVEYPGWRFYAAAVFDEKNPWWIVMPDINRYLARASWMLRQGDPANDVAVYLPEEDALTEFLPSELEMAAARSTRGLLNRKVDSCIGPIVEAGYNLDFVDDGTIAARGQAAGAALAFGAVRYRVVVLPRVQRIPLATYRKLETFVQGGGTLISIGAPPSEAPGYHATKAEHDEVRAISRKLFGDADAKGEVAKDENALTVALKQHLQPDVALAHSQTDFGFTHRRMDGADVYFVCNTSALALKDTATFRVRGSNAEWWDPMTGRTTPVPVRARSKAGAAVAIDLPPYGAGFFVFRSGTATAAPQKPAAGAAHEAVDLSHDWDVSFRNASPEQSPVSRRYATLASWTDSADTRYFSGVATYTKTIQVSADRLASGGSEFLDFGKGHAAHVAAGEQGLHADFQPPIGDAAVIFVNGRRAGSIWCPPYRLDVTDLLKPGPNELRVEVANRAVNYMADHEHHPLPDYKRLNADRRLGGHRFVPQDMDRIEPTPSGLLGPVRLVFSARN